MLKFSMRYVQKDANGRLRYRRGIPKRLRPLFGGKSEFLKVLGKTEEEALQHYAKVSLHFNKRLDAAKKLMPAASSNRAVSAFELSKSLSELGISTGKPINEDEEHYRDSLIEEILLEFNRDPETYEYVDVPEEKQALVKALHSGIDKHMQTIADAFAEYLETKAKKTPLNGMRN